MDADDKLNKRKEPGPYFHLALSGLKVTIDLLAFLRPRINVQICDRMQPILGFYTIPTPAYYGRFYPAGAVNHVFVNSTSPYLCCRPDARYCLRVDA